MGRGSRPRDSICSLTFGSRNALTNSVLSFAMTSLGVAAGANMPNQASTSNPGKPDSFSVGTSGSALEREIEVTAIGRRRPAFTLGTAAEMFSNRIWTSPPSTAAIEGPLPLNGTWSMSMPAASLNISPEICTEVPVPGEPKFSFPGFALA